MAASFFSSKPVFSQQLANIDRENGVLFGVTIARLGPTKSHGGIIDRVFLAQIVEQAALRPQGLKARFGHPNLCSAALGTYLGRFKNYALHDDCVKADLYLDSTAKNTPNGNLFDYILDMAEKNPDMLGASIVFEAAEFEKDETENKGSDSRRFRLKNLRATDIVDDPAATDSLFSADSMPAMASAFLDNNPLLADFIFSNPESVIEFLNNYMHNNMNISSSLKEKFQKLFGLSAPPAELPDVSLPPAMPSEDASLNDDPPLTLESLQTELADAFAAFEDFKATAAAQKQELQLALDAAVNALSEAEKQSAEKIALLESEILSHKAHISGLTDRLAAKPSIPTNVTDPQLSTSVHLETKDETGKQMLKNLPPDLKRKLKAHSQ